MESTTAKQRYHSLCEALSYVIAKFNVSYRAGTSRLALGLVCNESAYQVQLVCLKLSERLDSCTLLDLATVKADDEEAYRLCRYGAAPETLTNLQSVLAQLSGAVPGLRMFQLV